MDLPTFRIQLFQAGRDSHVATKQVEITCVTCRNHGWPASEALDVIDVPEWITHHDVSIHRPIDQLMLELDEADR